jgi:hypothetical protein
VKEQKIEYPIVGATYHHDEYGVYEYDEFPPSSVLAGQTRRRFLASFSKLEDAQKAYPDAEWINGSAYEPVYLPDEPPEWFNPANAGESWNGE